MRRLVLWAMALVTLTGCSCDSIFSYKVTTETMIGTMGPFKVTLAETYDGNAVVSRTVTLYEVAGEGRESYIARTITGLDMDGDSGWEVITRCLAAENGPQCNAVLVRPDSYKSHVSCLRGSDEITPFTDPEVREFERLLHAAVTAVYHADRHHRHSFSY